MNKRQLSLAWRLLTAASLFTASGAVSAAEFTLVAEQIPKTMADGSTVQMWAYRLSTGTTATVPGPILRVPAGEPLIIHVQNSLPQLINGGNVPTSVIVPGQRAASTPVMFTDATGRQRVRSFTHEAAAGATATYTWNNPQPGTYLYHSGTHPQVQVQMGLYGIVIVEAGPNLAYPGVPYDAEVPLLYSEVDPDLHAAVAGGSYGNAATPGAMTSTLHYAPKYFLVNGESYLPGATAPIATGAAGTRTLLRLLNAGLNTRVPVLQGLDMSLIAEDGKPYPYARTQYSAPLAAMKTLDAVIVPTSDGEFPIYDRRLALTNNAASPGGLLRILRAGGGLLAQGDAYTVSEDTLLSVPAPGVLGNDLNPAGGTLTASIATPAANGTATLNADGSFSYQPNANFVGADSFGYQASNGSQTASATVTLTVTPVNDPPTVGADVATTTVDTAVVIDVLANDSGPDGSVLALVGVDNPSAQGGSVAVTGPTVTYTPPTGFTGTDTFVYVIADDQNLMSSGTVTVNVQ